MILVLEKPSMYNNLVLSPGKPLPNGKRSMGGVDIFISLLQSMGSEGAIDPSDEKDLFDKFCNKPFMAKIVHKESQNLDGSERTNANIVASRLLHAEEIVALSSLYGKALVPGSGNKPLKNDAEFDFESEEDDIPF
jgi:hypothetical protein